MNARAWMSVLVTVGAAVLPFTVPATAGEESQHELALKQMLKAIDRLTMTLAGITDADTAQAARPELKKGAEYWLDVKAKTAKLPPPEKAEKDRLAKEYKGKMDDAIKKLFTEVGRVRSIPSGKDALQELKAVVDSDAKADDAKPKAK